MSNTGSVPGYFTYRDKYIHKQLWCLPKCSSWLDRGGQDKVRGQDRQLLGFAGHWLKQDAFSITDVKPAGLISGLGGTQYGKNRGRMMRD